MISKKTDVNAQTVRPQLNQLISAVGRAAQSVRDKNAEQTEQLRTLNIARRSALQRIVMETLPNLSQATYSELTTGEVQGFVTETVENIFAKASSFRPTLPHLAALVNSRRHRLYQKYVNRKVEQLQGQLVEFFEERIEGLERLHELRAFDADILALRNRISTAMGQLVVIEEKIATMLTVLTTFEHQRTHVNETQLFWRIEHDLFHLDIASRLEGKTTDGVMPMRDWALMLPDAVRHWGVEMHSGLH